MIVARGLGRPGGLIVSSGLGQILYEAPDGTTYAYHAGQWHLVTDMYVKSGGSWIKIADLKTYRSGAWTQVWQAP